MKSFRQTTTHSSLPSKWSCWKKKDRSRARMDPAKLESLRRVCRTCRRWSRSWPLKWTRAPKTSNNFRERLPSWNLSWRIWRGRWKTWRERTWDFPVSTFFGMVTLGSFLLKGSRMHGTDRRMVYLPWILCEPLVPCFVLVYCDLRCEVSWVPSTSYDNSWKCDIT